MSVLGQMLVKGLQADPQGFVRIIGEFISTLTISSTFTGTNGVVTITQAPTTNVIDSYKLLGMTSSGKDGFNPWILDVYSKIRDNCYISLPVAVGAIPLPSTLAFQTMTTPSWSQVDLKTAHENNMSDPQGAVMDVIGSGIELDLRTNITKAWSGTYESISGGATSIQLNF